MSQPGGTRGPDERRRELIWSALFLLSSLVGGLAAADIAHVSTIRALIVSVLVAAVVTLVVHYGLPRAARNEARSIGQHTGPHAVPPGSSVADQPSQVPDQPSQAAVVRLMQPPAPATAPWWNHGETPPAGGAAPAEVPVAADLSSYLDSALIAQCPNCGSFRIDTDARAPEWRFRCRDCKQIWSWQPGNPWPALQIRPGLRKGK